MPLQSVLGQIAGRSVVGYHVRPHARQTPCLLAACLQLQRLIAVAAAPAARAYTAAAHGGGAVQLHGAGTGVQAGC